MTSVQQQESLMSTKTFLIIATVLTIGGAISASPSLAQTRQQMQTVGQPGEYSRDLLPNYDRAVNGSDASTPGHN
jgi:hypothetical protein